MPKKIRVVTQSEIARLSGVSQAAVSAILNDSGKTNVSEETRLRVLEIAGKLGYRMRKRAEHSLSDRREMRDVLLVRHKSKSVTDEPWMKEALESLFSKLTQTCSDRLAEANIRLVLLYEDPKRVVHWLKESDVAGVLWHLSDSDTAPMEWVASRYPLVLINRVWNGKADCDVVSLNQEKVMEMALDHLWEKGHRKIAMYGHWAGNSFFKRRVQAYRSYTEEKGIRDYSEFRKIRDDEDIPAVEKVEEILKLWRGMGCEAPTAMVLPDVFALPMIRLAGQFGISIPEDLSVVGMDNAYPCELVTPSLTSVDSHFDRMAEMAVEALLQRMDQPDKLPCNIQITPRLVVRHSVWDMNVRKESVSA